MSTTYGREGESCKVEPKEEEAMDEIIEIAVEGDEGLVFFATCHCSNGEDIPF